MTIKYLHMIGRNGCNFGIHAEYLPGAFPKELKCVERTFAMTGASVVSWRVPDGRGHFEHQVTRREVRSTEDEIEEHTGCRTEETKPDSTLTFKA